MYALLSAPAPLFRYLRHLLHPVASSTPLKMMGDSGYPCVTLLATLNAVP